MPKKIYNVRLSQKEREHLERFIKQGKQSARAINRVRILLLADEQKTDDDISKLLGVCKGTVYNTRKKYNEENFENIIGMLKEKPRSGAPLKIGSRLEATITMIACSEPPEGYSRWTLRLIAEKLVELEAVDTISHVTVRTALKKTNLNLGSRNDGV